MAVEGVPEKIDKLYLHDLAEGTQYQYRQTYRSLDLTTDDDRPTLRLRELVDADQADRPRLFGKIMQDRYPDLTGLPPDAAWDDFFSVLRDHYDVTSEMQQRKTLTFFVHAADYAGLEISPSLRPAKRGPGSRQRREGPQTDMPTDVTRAILAQTERDAHDERETGAMPSRRHDISLGDAGSVSVIVDVDRWWELSDDQFLKLRKLIKDLEALGDSGN